ncbi:uncharacterized protein FA14DRAFT_182905 [Meira miltonrushii]|uniref:Uncharacterized protein n=1 Tax=Meira miltonrushii TaxID=1280837 RepID=A0A316V118_9BASI|nr:uncharacterized protein FA14DRAFT_182905 [Meira miltonrushii]PWN31239.1 hypothetical protein FA14DRAFT_182905 [Meira miltonrushii]
MSASSSSSNTPSTGSPTKPSQITINKPRLPLAELPVANFVGRPSSPIKTHPSPTKPSKLLPSPKVGRTSSGHSNDSPFQSRSSANIRRSTPASPNGVQVENDESVGRSLFPIGNSPGKTLADLPIEQSPVISDEIRHAKHSPAAKLRRKFREQEAGLSPLSGSPGKKPMATSEKGKSPAIQLDEEPSIKPEEVVTPVLGAQKGAFASPSTIGVPQSLPRKKDRVRASEVAHLVMDEDEDQSAEARGSPSPSKSITKMMSAARYSPIRSTPTKINDGFVVPTSIANKGNAVGLGIDHPMHINASPKPEITWTVLPDSSEDEEDENSLGFSSLNDTQISFNDGPEVDKENMKPDPIIIQGRKRGTGGRLSLVATAAQADDANTSSETTMTSISNRQN